MASDPNPPLTWWEDFLGIVLSQHFLFGPPVAILCIILVVAIPSLRFCIPLYIGWLALDWSSPWTGGRPHWQWIWRLGYVPKRQGWTLVYDGKKPPNPAKNFMIVVHPHGFMGQTCLYQLLANPKMDDIFPNVDFRICTLNVIFLIPVLREIAMFVVGCIPVSRESIRAFLETGQNKAVMIVPGGAEEAIYADKAHHLVLRKRKGFVREALQMGVTLVPMYGFSEHKIYDVISNPTARRFQQAFKRATSFAPIMLRGEWGVFQKKVHVACVIGEPMYLPKIADPSVEVVDKWHKEYVARLEALFAKYKGKLAPEGDAAELVIVA